MKGLLALRIKILRLLSTLTSLARSIHPSYQSPFSHLRVYLPVLVVCVLTTHTSFRCIRCVVIVLHFSSWSDDPHFLLSSFNPYLSVPLPLLSLIHLSHGDVFLLFSLSHNILVVLLILLVRATLHPVLPGRNLILHKLVSKLD